MNKLPVKKAQEVINEVRKHARLDGVWEVVCESGEAYLTKQPARYKTGNAQEIEYVEIRKPKQIGGEWVNLWTQDPRAYTPKAPQDNRKFDELMAAISEVQAAQVEILAKVEDVYRAVQDGK